MCWSGVRQVSTTLEQFTIASKQEDQDWSRDEDVPTRIILHRRDATIAPFAGPSSVMVEHRKTFMPDVTHRGQTNQVYIPSYSSLEGRGGMAGGGKTGWYRDSS